MVAIGVWLEANARVLTIVGAIAAGATGLGKGVHDYVVRVDTEITAVEQEQEGVTGKLDQIQKDVVEVKCMTIMHHQNGDPLDCINDG